MNLRKYSSDLTKNCFEISYQASKKTGAFCKYSQSKKDYRNGDRTIAPC